MTLNACLFYQGSDGRLWVELVLGNHQGILRPVAPVQPQEAALSQVLGWNLPQ